MAASSSQTRIVPSGMRSLILYGLALGRHHRQQDAEQGSARLRFAFDDAAMIGDDFRDQRKSESGAMRFGRNEGIENIRQQIGGDARTIVPHGDLKRQAQALFVARPAAAGRNA